MEREVLVTGIGGQGVQLAAQVLARGATLEGREVMFFGVYGGMMRGGNTDAPSSSPTGRSQAPPVVSHAWSAIAMHDEYWEPDRAEAAAGRRSCSSTTRRSPRRSTRRRHGAPGRRRPSVATELGNALGGVDGDGRRVRRAHRPRRRSTRSSRRCAQSIPSYRTQHIEANERALARGLGPRSPAGAHPAWEERGACLTRPRPIKSRGTVTIDVEHCKGCELCIPACPPRVLDDVGRR